MNSGRELTKKPSLIFEDIKAELRTHAGFPLEENAVNHFAWTTLLSKFPPGQLATLKATCH